jgi:hypothetical protein
MYTLEQLLHRYRGAPRSEVATAFGGELYIRFYLLTRLLVGLLGMLLPIVLIGGDWLFLGGHVGARGSMSAYYHSGMRDVFVAVMCIIGFFLITYKAFLGGWGNVLSTVAGVAAIGVALLPTAPDPGGLPTALEMEFGVRQVAAAHFACATVFIVALAMVSIEFSYKEKARHNTGHQRFHRACGCSMIVAIALYAASDLAGAGPVLGVSTLLVTEVACTLLFGMSWLLKGGELSPTLVRHGVYGRQVSRGQLGHASRA